MEDLRSTLLGLLVLAGLALCAVLLIAAVGPVLLDVIDVIGTWSDSLITTPNEIR